MTKKRSRTRKQTVAVEAAEPKSAETPQETQLDEPVEPQAAEPDAPAAFLDQSESEDLSESTGSAEPDVPAEDAIPEDPASEIPDSAAPDISADNDIPEDPVRVEITSDARHAPRHTHRVKTVVHFKESSGDSWKEMIEVATVSRNGAGMLLSRPCPVGRIVSLVMEMPRKLRVYDHFAEVYPVAGLVQNCTELMQGETLAYHVGVAFIGKQLPDSFRRDPTTTYRITGANENGLWSVAEMQKGFQDREHMRYWKQIVLSLTYRDEVQKKTERAAVQTRDISRGGMAVWGPLKLGVGERVKVSSREHDFVTMATVKNRTDHPHEDSKSLVHIQFEQQFPVETIRGVEGDGDSGAEKPDHS